MSVIDRKLVFAYVRLQEAITRSTKNNKERRVEILAKLKMGDVLPTDGPYLIDLSQNGGKDFSWEDEYRTLLIKHYIKKYGAVKAVKKAEERMQAMVDAAPNKTAEVIQGTEYVGGVKLLHRPNPQWRRLTERVAS